MNYWTPPTYPRALATACTVALLAGLANTALAQQYKVVDPSEQTADTNKPQATPATTLPYNVKQAVSRYPVVLYAAKSCLPCDQSRQWLKDHAIPFTEYSVDSNNDIIQLKQRFDDTSVPVITIGSQVIHGFANAELQSFTDAAGYPKQTRLPGYIWPAPQPLAPPSPTPPLNTPSKGSTESPSPQIPPPAKNGIQF